MINPDPCWVPEESEIEQGSGKKPDNDGVCQVLHHQQDQPSEARQSVH